MKRGITRAKEHLTRTPSNVSACPLYPEEVVEELKAAMKAKKKENVAIEGWCKILLVVMKRKKGSKN